MKIVINRCYGGYGLSMFAVEKYLAKQGKKAFFYDYDFRGKKHHKVSSEAEVMCFYASTKDCGDVVDKIKDEGFFDWRGIDRTDKDLVSIVEEFGDKCNGSCAKLKVVEIPDDVDFYINEYDGMETVEKVHRSWC